MIITTTTKTTTTITSEEWLRRENNNDRSIDARVIVTHPVYLGRDKHRSPRNVYREEGGSATVF